MYESEGFLDWAVPTVLSFGVAFGTIWAVAYGFAWMLTLGG